MQLSAITWGVEQSGHAAAVGDLLLTVLGAGGDGCHLETQHVRVNQVGSFNTATELARSSAHPSDLI